MFGLQGVHVAPLIGVHDGGERDEDGDALLEVEVANEELRRRTAMWRAERIGRGGKAEGPTRSSTVGRPRDDLQYGTRVRDHSLTSYSQLFQVKRVKRRGDGE